MHVDRQIISTTGLTSDAKTEDKETVLYSQEEKTLMFISHEFHIVKKSHVQNNVIKIEIKLLHDNNNETKKNETDAR